jgi:hypothetical protein
MAAPPSMNNYRAYGVYCRRAAARRHLVAISFMGELLRDYLQGGDEYRPRYCAAMIDLSRKTAKRTPRAPAG